MRITPEIRAKLAERIEEKGISNTEAGRQSGVSNSVIGRILRGVCPTVTDETGDKLLAWIGPVDDSHTDPRIGEVVRLLQADPDAAEDLLAFLRVRARR